MLGAKLEVLLCIGGWEGIFALLCLVAQLYPTLRDPMDPMPTRLLCPWGFFKLEYWSGLPCPPLGDFPNPEIEPRFPTFQADSLPSEPLGKPMNTGVGSLPILQGIFLIQELKQGVLHCKQILYQLGYQGSCRESLFYFNKLRQSSVHLVSIYTFITYCICLMNHLLRNKNTFKTVL